MELAERRNGDKVNLEMTKELSTETVVANGAGRSRWRKAWVKENGNEWLYAISYP